MICMSIELNYIRKIYIIPKKDMFNADYKLHTLSKK